MTLAKKCKSVKATFAIQKHARPLALAFAALAALAGPASAAGRHTLTGHVPFDVSSAVPVGAEPASTQLHLSIALPFRNQSELNGLLQDLYNPLSPQYQQYLTAQQFTDEFGPTTSDYASAIAYLKAQGLTVTGTTPNRKVIDVSGSVTDIQNALQTDLLVYQRSDGSRFYAPDRDPSVDESVGNLFESIHGLDDAHPPTPLYQAAVQPRETGSGYAGGLAPNDVRTAYNVPSSLNGSGVTLGLLEFGPYATSDVQSYESNFGLPNVTLDNVLLDGVSGGGTPSVEDTLDIDVMLAYCPDMSKLMVYEGTDDLDILNRVASDDQVKVLSISYGWSTATSEYQSESTVYQQLGAEGISVCVATGDSGSWTSSSITNPADQPYITAVGGTALSTNGAGGSYSSESGWTGSGGGYSPFWGIPSYQDGVSGLANGSMRNAPDVAMPADPNASGYAVYVNGAWSVWGGTSAASPAWASTLALVDEQRASNGQAAVGFFNPTLYPLAEGSNYHTDLHDITSGSNGAYTAVAGYDNVTGWGSPNVANLANALTTSGPIKAGLHTLTPVCAPSERLDDNGGGTNDGNKIQIWQANGENPQNWNFANVGGSDYNLAVNLGPYCLDGGAATSGTPTQLWSCNGTADQAWAATAVSGGYTLKSAESGLCLDVNNAGDTNGTVVQSWTCNSTIAQTWMLDYTTPSISNGAHTLTPACATGSRLDDNAAGTTDGNKIQIWQANGTGAQSWSFANVGGAGYNLAVEGPYCLDGGAATSGAATQLWGCNGTADQQWNATAVYGGYTLASQQSGLCLDVTGAGTANGTVVESYTCNGTSAQTWAVN